jgi:multiple sugar transport system permease protein
MATEKRSDWLPDTGIRGKLREYREAWREERFALLLVLPTVLFLLLLLWFPFVRGVWMSLHDWPFLGDPEFIGLENYSYLFGWEVFYTSLKATLIYSTATVLQLVLALTFALLVADLSSFENIISGLYMIPYTMPPVVTGAIWLFILDPSFGPFFQVLMDLGILEGPIYWGVNGDLAITVVTLVTAWTFWPFMFLVILASRQSIPDEYYEAAKVYGASRWQMLRRITLPQLKSAILVALSIRLVWNLAKISQPLQMTGGGPGYETSVLAILLYRFAYNSGDMGQGYAVGVVLLAITLVFVALFIREFERTRGEA